MPESKAIAPWIETEQGSVLSVALSSWRHFHDYIRQEMLEFAEYIWRGQRDSAWKLETTLHRLLRDRPEEQMQIAAQEHLARFKLAVRGRRGPNPPRINDDDEWWALGQHQGLATPLLDWTSAPFVALYFAFEDATPSASGLRAVYALNDPKEANARLRVKYADKVTKPYVDIVRPNQDDNSRLVSQAALFTRGPLGRSLDDWVETEGDRSVFELVKITIPDTDREECLRTLDRMNINHLSLFPDVYGSSCTAPGYMDTR